MLKQVIDNVESRGGNVQTVQVQCPFCHQQVYTKITDEIMNNRELRRDLAIESCSCPAAIEEAKKKEKIELLDRNLCGLIGEKSFDPVDEEVYEAIRALSKLIAFKKIHRTNVHLSKIEKIVISRDADGITNINREIKQVSAKSI